MRDETVIVASRETIAALIADATRWPGWWPGLEIQVTADRGPGGMAWAVSGALVGGVEVVLVEVERAVAVRYLLAVDPTMPGSSTTPRQLPTSPRGRRELADLRRHQQLSWKRTVWALKDELEITVERRQTRYGT